MVKPGKMSGDSLEHGMRRKRARVRDEQHTLNQTCIELKPVFFSASHPNISFFIGIVQTDACLSEPPCPIVILDEISHELFEAQLVRSRC